MQRRGAQTDLPREALPDAEKEPFTWLSVRYSMAEWLVRLLVEQYGRETTERMLQAFLTTRPTTIRTCTDRITPEQLKKRLEESGVTVREGRCLPYALQISGYNYLNKIPAFREGLFVVQDESSMFPVEVSGIKAGDRVLDLCAAPGGKTFHAAERVGSEGQVIARDLTEYKTEILQENLENVQVLDLTGCSLENILYYPDREIPVLALLEDGNAVLITGFNERNVVLMDPQTGRISCMGLNDASAWFEENGNMFVSCVGMQ